METQTPRRSPTQPRLQSMFWFLAAVMTITATLDFFERRDVLRVVSGFCLVATYVVIAMSGLQPAGGKKVAAYGFLALALALTVWGWFR